MKAQIITIGDEILIGQIVDTNSAFISKALNRIGIQVNQIISIQDNKDHILSALNNASKSSDLVIITGGLGPTKDDITKKTFVEFFQDKLIVNKRVEDHIREIWKKYIKQPLLQVNLDQALVPSKASILMNSSGTAPGMWMEKGNTIFISLPGVPFEMKALIKNEVLPRLSNSFNLPFIVHKTLLTYGLGESVIADRISDWENNLPGSIKLAYLPNLGRVRLRLSSKGFNKYKVENEINFQIKNLLPLISDIFVGFEEDNTLEQIIANKFVKLGKTLSVAESCSGGKISEKFTSNAGASKFFKGGIVAYNSAVKKSILGVDPIIINKYSVVSKEVSELMALGAKKIFNSDYSIATTGNAGPSKGQSNAEIGTVFIAVATPLKIYSQKFTFGDKRQRVLIKTLNMALTMIHKEIFKND